MALIGALTCADATEHWGCGQAELGDIVYVEMPEAGSQMDANAVFGVVESVKARPHPFCASPYRVQGI